MASCIAPTNSFTTEVTSPSRSRSATSTFDVDDLIERLDQISVDVFCLVSDVDTEDAKRLSSINENANIEDDDRSDTSTEVDETEDEEAEVFCLNFQRC